MGVEAVECLVLSCDKCGAKAEGFEDSFVQHFDNVFDLEKWAADAEWVIEPRADGEDGAATCWRCVARAEGKTGDDLEEAMPEAFDR